ncbi:MAG: beta-galactosidase [Polyangiaceae bacterium]|nr:beta-galactosidase [Polyangiaceae bacterium]MCW5792466.1 beta-galactosidase [Polyangiaceae bacterium]
MDPDAVTASPHLQATPPRVRLTRSGLVLGPGDNPRLPRPEGSLVPLIAGSVHYFRMAPETWAPALQAIRTLGCHLVDVYIPWSVHELRRGQLDFGRVDPRLDLARFLRLAEEIGLFAIARPGPHINAELTYFGIPKRVIWDTDCQARSPSGEPVALPMLPLSFPVPSYASQAFREEAREWLRAVTPELSPLCWPSGPVVMVQVDNEASFYFRDGVYDQDYHPDAVAAYREHLRREYGSDEALRRAHLDEALSLSTLTPPTALTAEHCDELTPHVDWARFQEELLGSAVGGFAALLREAGLPGVPLSHNLPPADLATPLDPARLLQEIDLVGADYYHHATPEQLRAIAYRTSALAALTDERQLPCFAAELGVGFPPFAPPLRPRDNAFAALSALAYGLRAFNLYMAVDRDRWIGALFTQEGDPRPEASFWRRLIDALSRLRFRELERRVEVSIVVPRSFRRLARVLHAFGPVSQTLLQLTGRGIDQAVLEGGVDRAGSSIVAASELIDQLWDALEARGVATELISDEQLDRALERSRWVVVVCSGALEPALAERARAAYASGKAVSVGPFLPTRDERMRGAAHPIPSGGVVPWQLSSARVAEQVTELTEALSLTRAPIDAPLRLTLHSDQAGVPRVAFVINPSHEAARGVLRPGSAVAAKDALDGAPIEVSSGEIALTVPASSVRVVELLHEA